MLTPVFRTIVLFMMSLALLPQMLAQTPQLRIEERSAVLEGRGFGDVGAYERLRGRIIFRFDPRLPENRAICDIDHAPRDADGFVRAEADFYALLPTDRERASGSTLFEISNRGGKASLSYFNRARGSRDPRAPAQFGDGFLMRRGLGLVWIGWQHDVPDGAGVLRLRVPQAKAGKDLRGLARSDWVVDERRASLPLAHRNHRAIPVADPKAAENRLTRRRGRDAERETVPRKSWRFGSVDREGFKASRTQISVDGGFEPGYIYELVYRAEEPAIVGLGLAAIRDAVLWAKNDPDCPFASKRALALGISQTGRFLRHFLYQGFNRGAGGRRAFDGLLIHTAGAGRGSFNHRYAQPSRDAHRYSAFIYPTDLFPFSGRAQQDGDAAARGLFDRLGDDPPKVMSSNSGYEYWGRAASLLHTDPAGMVDVAPLPNERIYHLRATQHFVDRFPPRRHYAEKPAYLGNPNDLLVPERALLTSLQDWVEKGRLPPPSCIPRISDGSLVRAKALAFPELRGFSLPTRPHSAYRADYGPRWMQGIIDHQPPGLGAEFPSLVPQVDPLGNEIAGVPTLETLVPLATYTPWALRLGLPGGSDELRDFRGCFLPLPRGPREARRAGDQRPSVAELYPTRAIYDARVEAAIETLVVNRFALEDDRVRLRRRADALWKLLVDDRPRAPKARDEYTLLSYNVWGLPLASKDLARRSEAMPAALKTFDPEIICLQEVWTESLRSSILEGLGEGWWASEGVAGGLVTFSKLPYSDSRFIRYETTKGLTFVERLARRGYLLVCVNTASGPIHVVNTHCAALWEDGGPRPEQIKELAKAIGGLANFPLVLAADLNTSASGSDGVRELAPLVQGGLRSALPPRRMRTGAPSPRIGYVGWPRYVGQGGWDPDHIFVRKGGGKMIEVTEAQVELDQPETALSDHNLLRMEFRLR